MLLVALVLQPQFRRLKTDGYFQPTTPACFHDHYNNMCLQMRMRRIAKDLRDSEGTGASILGVITLRDYTGFEMVVSHPRGNVLLRNQIVGSIRTSGSQRQCRKIEVARIKACCICGVPAIPVMWNGSTGCSYTLICVYRRMVLKVKCASLTRTLDEEKSSIGGQGDFFWSWVPVPT